MGIKVLGDQKRIVLSDGNNESRYLIGDDKAIPTEFRPVERELPSDGAVDTDSSDDGGQANSGRLDPSTAFIGSSDSGGSSTGKRRGRKPGSRNSKSGTGSSSTSKTTDTLAALLYTVHVGVGGILKTDFLKLSKAESKELATAVWDVTQLYEVEFLDEKGMAWARLVAVMANVYFFKSKSVEDISTVKKAQVVAGEVIFPDFSKSAVS